MTSIAERFYARFQGLTRAHGTYTIDERAHAPGKVSGQARTVREAVTVATWEEHLQGGQGLGIVPINDDNKTTFGAIDIDVYDLDLVALEKRIKTARLPLTVCRTKSGGAHLYLFLSEVVSAGVVRHELQEWSVVLGFPGVEIFPKQSELGGEDDVGNWINMPYHGGKRTVRYAVIGGKNITDPEKFLEHADRIATTGVAIQEIEIQEDNRLEEAPPCLQYLARAGFPQGTRNRALYNVAVYLKARYPDDWSKHLEKYNQDFMEPPLSVSEVQTVAKSVGRKDYYYTCKEAPLSTACNRTVCLRRKYGIGGSESDPGVALDGLVKIQTDPPVWLLNVDRKRLRIGRTEDLTNQRRFNVRCVEDLHVFPKLVKQEMWRQVIDRLLKKVEIVEAPPNAGLKGQFIMMLEEFCAETAPSTERDDLLMGRPLLESYEEEGMMYCWFRTNDVLHYCKKRDVRITNREAWMALREHYRNGQNVELARHKRFKIRGRTVWVWGIPDVERQTEDFPVEHVEPGDEY